MIYKNSEIPSNFNKIAEISDNYIVWVRENRLQSNNSYEAYIQYYYPSFSYLYTDDYKIKTGSNYVLDANYINNGMYSYIDSYDLNYYLDTITTSSGDVETSDYFRTDYPMIFCCGMILVLIFTAICVRLLPRTRR